MTAQPMPARAKRWPRILLGIVLVFVVLGLAGFGYINYRISRFAEQTFRPESTPPRSELPDTPTAVAQVVATAAPAPPTPTVDPADPNRPTAVPLPPTATATPDQAVPTPTPLVYGNSPVIKRLKAGERITVLLLGFGGPGHDGGYLTDSIEVMSFEPKTGTATLISIPRDLWVLIPSYQGRGGYWGKINEAYTVGMGNVDRNDNNVPYAKHDAGGQLAMKTVAQVLGIPIDYWVSMDFVGFKQFIDAIGGVDVNVEKAFTDYQYPNNDDASVDPSYRTVHFDAGPQHMDGERAIVFARSRYSAEEGNDFSRARRQQLLMTAVKEQTLRVETIPKFLTLLDSFEGHLRMSFTFTEAKDLIGWGQEQVRAKRQFPVRNGVLDTGGPLLYSSVSGGGAYIILPRAGQSDYSAIQRYVQDLLGDESSASGTPGRPGTPGATGTPTRAP